MRVERLQSEYDIDVRYRHFPLHPETPEQGMTLEELFAGRNFDLAAAASRMQRLMEAEGLPYGNRTKTYNSRLAQELATWADDRHPASAIHDALFRAYFVDDTNLAVVEHLVEIATSVGLPPDEARTAVEQRQYRDAVDADWQHSRRLGVTGVPTFVAGPRGMVGAQSFEDLENLVKQAGAQRRDAGLP